jgi:hypothetical protein
MHAPPESRRLNNRLGIPILCAQSCGVCRLPMRYAAWRDIAGIAPKQSHLLLLMMTAFKKASRQVNKQQ